MLEVKADEEEDYQNIANFIIDKHDYSKKIQSATRQVQHKSQSLASLIFEVMHFVGIIILYFKGSFNAFIPTFNRYDSLLVKTLEVIAVSSLFISFCASIHSVSYDFTRKMLLGYFSYYQQVLKVSLKWMTMIFAFYLLISPSRMTGVLVFISTALSLVLISGPHIQQIKHTFLRHSQKWYLNVFVILISNIAFIHFITSILLQVLLISNDQDKMFNAKIPNKQDQEKWYVTYVIAFYWESTIMCRVGLGDITPRGWKQALIITVIQLYAGFIQTFFVIHFAKNCAQIIDINKKFTRNQQIFSRILKNVCSIEDESYLVSQMPILRQLYEKQQILRIYKDRMNFNQLIQSLPQNLQENYKKEQYSKKLIELPFFKNLSNDTIDMISIKLNSQFCYPEKELTQNQKGTLNRILICKNGVINIKTRRAKSQINSLTIGQLINGQKQFKLVNSDILSQIKRDNISLVSSSYIELYYLAYRDLYQVLELCECDRQYYFQSIHSCFYRSVYFNYLIQCQICKQAANQHSQQSFFEHNAQSLQIYHLPIQCPYLVYCIQQKNLVLKKSINQNNQKILRKRHRMQKNTMSCSLKSWKRIFKVWSAEWGIDQKQNQHIQNTCIREDDIQVKQQNNVIVYSETQFDADKAQNYVNYFIDFNVSLISFKYNISRKFQK